MSTLERLVLVEDLSLRDFVENSEKNGDVILAVREGLSQYNESQRSDPSAAPVVLAVYDDGHEQLVAGLSGRTAYGWLRIDNLWVAEQIRGRGNGKRLISYAEKVAVDRGCHGVHLDTYGFQAPGFYERLGYGRFGELPRYPDEDVHGFSLQSQRTLRKRARKFYSPMFTFLMASMKKGLRTQTYSLRRT